MFDVPQLTGEWERRGKEIDGVRCKPGVEMHVSLAVRMVYAAMWFSGMGVNWNTCARRLLVSALGKRHRRGRNR